MKKMTKQKIKAMLLLGILLLIVFLLFHKNILANDIVIKFESKQNKQIGYQIFYTTDKEKKFNEKESYTVVAEKSDIFQNNIFRLKNIERIEKLRIDFGTDPGVVQIKNFEIIGTSIINIPIERFGKYKKYQIEDHTIKDQILTIKSQYSDPFIILDPYDINNDITVVPKSTSLLSKIFSISLFFLIFTFLFLIFKLKGIGAHSQIDLALVVGVFIMLCIPMSKIDSKDIDLKENRTLATLPKLIEKNTLNLHYGKEFEKYFNDRFRTRKHLIDLQSSIKKIVNKKRKENDKAFSGCDDWIFFKGSNSIANYQNRIPFSKGDLIKIKENFKNRIKWLSDLGIKYYVFIPPDKNRIYGEYYPKYIHKIGEKSRLEKMINFIANEIDFKIITPHAKMIDHKKKELLFYKADTHWTEYGAFIGYKVLLNEISIDFPSIKTLKESNFEFSENQTNSGDLSNMLLLNSDHYEKVIYKKFVFRKYNFQYLPTKKNEHSHTKNPKADLKVIVFIDSFGGNIAPNLSETFGEVICIADYNINKYQKKIQEERPDIIIHESVERLCHNFTTSNPVLRWNK